MSRLLAPLAGSLLGLAGLPLSGAEIPGLLWPLPFFFMTGRWKTGFKSALVDFLIFVYARFLVQNIWLCQAVRYYLPDSFFKTGLIYLSANLAISSPFVLVGGVWFYFLRIFNGFSSFRDKRRRLIFVLSFPLINYLAAKLSEIFLFPALPGGKLAEKFFFLDNFSRIYFYLGAEGFEFFILASLIILILSIFSVCRSGLLFLLLPWLAVIFLQTDKNPTSMAGREKARLNLLLVPWSDNLPDNASRETALKNLLSRSKAANTPRVDLIIWGETALPGPAETGRDMERAREELLLPSQALIFGGNRREFGPGRFKNFNAAYVLYGDRFRYDIYKKENLVPFVEYLPRRALKLGMKIISPEERVFDPGETKLSRFKNYIIGAGVCYDQYVNKWHVKRDSKVDLYIFINREYAFRPLGKKILLRSALAQALQTGKPVVRLTNGGFSGLMGERRTKEAVKWDSRSQTALCRITPGGEDSFFYKRGHYWPLLILFCHGLLMIPVYINPSSPGPRQEKSISS